MPTWDRQSYYYSGQGVVLLGEYDPTTGQALGLVPLGDVTALSITIDTDVEEYRESQSGQRSVALRLPKEIRVGLSMTCQNVARDVLAMALRGQATSVQAGTATDEAVTVRLGRITALAHPGVSSVVVKQGSTTLTPWSEGAPSWDYQLNPAAGSIRWAETPATSGLENGDTVQVSYAYGAHGQVEALTQAARARYLRYEGLNTADAGAPCIVEVWRCELDPAKELGWITAEGIAALELTGAVYPDPTRTSGSKYFRVQLLR